MDNHGDKLNYMPDSFDYPLDCYVLSAKDGFSQDRQLWHTLIGDMISGKIKAGVKYIGTIICHHNFLNNTTVKYVNDENGKNLLQVR